MREPSGHGIRGRKSRGCPFCIGPSICESLRCWARARSRMRRPSRASCATPATSISSAPAARCATATPTPATVNATSTTALSGIPAGTTIRNAYLYWGGSGGTADTSVTFNGSPITASRTFAATYTGVTPSLPFFGAFANVTSIVNTTRNGNYTFGGLAVVTGSPHCDVSAVVSGWSLIVIYESASERAARHQPVRRPGAVPRQPGDPDARRLPRAGDQHRRPHRGVHARGRPGQLRRR